MDVKDQDDDLSCQPPKWSVFNKFYKTPNLMSRGEKLMVKSPNLNAYDDYLTQAGSSKVNVLSRVNSTSNTVPMQLKHSAASVYGVAYARKEYLLRVGSAQLNQ